MIGAIELDRRQAGVACTLPVCLRVVADMQAFGSGQANAGERMGDTIPNGSMSMIHVQDLARLHIAAMENPTASGRYFGVKKSWHWRAILKALEKAWPAYTRPDIDPDEQAARATEFDLSRQDTLGVELRDIDDIVQSVVDELQRRAMI